MISRVAFLKVFLGSFFIQSSWSFEKMQSLGFAAAIAPALKEIHGGKDQRVAAYKRHLEHYNAHPYMASPVLGAAINIEEQAAKGPGVDATAVSKFKKMIMAPYGAIGDSFFWGSLRPMASAIGVLATLLWGWKGPVVFLILFNFFHLWMRWTGLRAGLRDGKNVVGSIMSLDLPHWSVRFKYLAAAALGVVSVVMLRSFAGPSWQPVERWFWLAAGFPAIVAAVVVVNLLFKRGFSISWLIYIITLPLMLYGIFLY